MGIYGSSLQGASEGTKTNINSVNVPVRKICFTITEFLIMFSYHFCIVLVTSYFMSTMHAFPIKSGSQAEDNAHDLKNRIGAWEVEPASDPVKSDYEMRRIRFDSPIAKDPVSSSEKQEDVMAGENFKRPNKQNVNCYNCNLLNSHMA